MKDGCLKFSHSMNTCKPKTIANILKKKHFSEMMFSMELRYTILLQQIVYIPLAYGMANHHYNAYTNLFLFTTEKI